ncbi:MAG: M1 family aminopeptidase [Planctomycetota bacterium]|nr:M1 family aminopeptidase [Planctomycetota bacterium]
MQRFFILMSFFLIAQSSATQEPEPGVSRSLALQRKDRISEIEYELDMDLRRSGPIRASIVIQFRLNDPRMPLTLDFNAAAENVLLINDKKPDHATSVRAGHILIPPEELRPGANRLRIDFVAGNPSLNRNEKFLYTLLVPDRASTVFPCFDQPDLKARFKLHLTLPRGWIASANGAVEKETRSGDRPRISFQKTKPISTYLFAFAAGEFQRISREIDGRKMTLMHRESDAAKVQRNLDDIFRIHAASLEWLEEYTGIDYPFEKFDFVLIPSFQYGGMEHTGNIFYNANSLFLDPSATRNQKLNRASLIAHETAHMWFGNLVTMKWFDDVWLKEVFANFMAAKIVHPGFPDIDHHLGFMLKHHPSAYGEDRTRGTYPIQQRLENLKDAGTLYGRIIYMKAPIVMRQLETIIGPGALQEGLRQYLDQFRYDNAVWDDLIRILDAKTKVDLAEWSSTWVKEPGTPEIVTDLEKNRLEIRQVRKTPQQKYWSQQIDIKVFSDGKKNSVIRAMIDGETTTIQLPNLEKDYDFYLANGSELGYGYFRLDPKSRMYLLENVHQVRDDVTRGAAWLALYEEMIRGHLDPLEFLPCLQRGLRHESETLNRQNLLSQLSTVYWKFLTPGERSHVAEEIETQLWKWIESDLSIDARSSYYKSLVSLASTPETIDRLYGAWQAHSDLHGLQLAESDWMTLAYELAIRKPEGAAEILATQEKRLLNEDRKKRFRAVAAALNPDASHRDKYFETLKTPANRRPERWVLEGLHYLHHPLRAAESEKYLLPSLELLEEIQRTGDIFFPKRWLVATFSGHRSPSAARLVNRFLANRPDYPVRLKNKILQAADLLFKASARQ